MCNGIIWHKTIKGGNISKDYIGKTSCGIGKRLKNGGEASIGHVMFMHV
jgi:hypothetical protein